MGKRKRIKFRWWRAALTVFFALGMVSVFSFQPLDPGFGLQSKSPKIHNILGVLGAYLASAWIQAIGAAAYVMTPLMTWLMWPRKRDRVSVRMLQASTLAVALSALIFVSNIFSDFGGQLPFIYSGGFVGKFTGQPLREFLGTAGALTLLIILFPFLLEMAIGLPLTKSLFVFGKKIGEYLKFFGSGCYKYLGNFVQEIRGYLVKMSERKPQQIEVEPESEPVSIDQNSNQHVENHLSGFQDSPHLSKIKESFAQFDEDEKSGEEKFPEISNFEMPSLDILIEAPARPVSLGGKKLEVVARNLEESLRAFGVEGKIERWQAGPVVSLFEYKPARGVKISKLMGLAEDISMSMAATQVRVVGQIPGKDVVGIEVPNETREDVYISELIKSKAFLESKARIPIAMGKDISGNVSVADLAEMPHMLIAGTTGSGKSMFEASVMASLLYKFSPAQLKMIMIDPKQTDLSLWNSIPHLLHPVVSDPKQAGNALRWACAEMEKRFEKISRQGCRNIWGLNQKLLSLSPEERIAIMGEDTILPALVILIDELADLMMTTGKDVETSICRLAQKARAAGIHLLVATQRPSTDVITGLIKANFPTRGSFRVASSIDSKTILNTQGAERLLGRGDMLFIPPGTTTLVRLHGSKIEEDEISKLVKHWAKQSRAHHKDEIIEYGQDPELESQSGESSQNLDPLFDQAKQMILETKYATVSTLQRKLGIGYARAGRLMDQMEAQGVVGPSQGSKPRDVLI